MGRDRNLRIINVENGKEIRAWTFPEPDKGAFGDRPLAFTADGQSLIVQGENVSVWDVSTAKEKSTWNLHKNKVLETLEKNINQSQEHVERAAVSPDGSIIAFSLVKYRKDERGNYHAYARLMILETATGKCLHQTDLEREFLRALAFSTDGKLLAGGSAWVVYVWNATTGKEMRQFAEHRGRINGLAFSHDGTRLASASEDSTVLIWRVPK
jgi:WD40 repeat protein